MLWKLAENLQSRQSKVHSPRRSSRPFARYPVRPFSRDTSKRNIMKYNICKNMSSRFQSPGGPPSLLRSKWRRGPAKGCTPTVPRTIVSSRETTMHTTSAHRARL